MSRLGLYRRAIQIIQSHEKVDGELEDDAHHFKIEIEHHNGIVTSCRGTGVRIPWSLCSNATEPLTRLVGVEITASGKDIRQIVNASEQCSHMLDLAVLMLGQVKRGMGDRRYDISIPLDAPDLPREIDLKRDGSTVFSWVIHNDVIVSPGEFSGVSIKTIGRWSRENLTDPDMQEAVGVIRMALQTSIARTMNLDALKGPTPLAQLLGPCYVFRPGYMEIAHRMVGSTVDFTKFPRKVAISLKKPPGH